MAGEIPALVDAGTAAEIEKVIEIIVEEYKVPLALLGAEEAYKVADRIREAKASVVVPPAVLSKRDGKPFVLADALDREGIPVIFQSGAGDGARTLPMNAGYFVHQGLSAETALEALTIHPAKLYRIEDRVGSLEPGKDADFIIFSEDPFEIGSRVLHVFSCGREVSP
jgi:imidazolonepropionase-like amidohydrolase